MGVLGSAEDEIYVLDRSRKRFLWASLKLQVGGLLIRFVIIGAPEQPEKV